MVLAHPRYRRTAVLAGPLVVLMPSLVCGGSIEGIVTFWGDDAGAASVEVTAHTSQRLPPDASFEVFLPGGAYALAVPDGTYYVAAFLNRSDPGWPPEHEEPLAWYDANGDGHIDALDTITVTSAGTVDGIDLDLGYVHVDVDATGAGDGSSWTHAFTDLASAIQAAVPGIEVWVAEGTYEPTQTSDRAASFATKSGVRVYGGFAGDEVTRNERDPAAHPTILSGDIGTPGLASDNSYHVIVAERSNRTAWLDGLTVTGGRADGAALDAHNQGGGLRARGGGVTLVNVDFVDNFALTAGGGIAALVGEPVNVYSCGFYGNASGWVGGGFHGTSFGGRIVNSVFTGNSAVFGGGAINIISTLEPIDLSQLSVAGNNAFLGGGLRIVNLLNLDYAVDNSIFWGNTVGQIEAASGLPPTVNYSIVEGGYLPGTVVETADPLLADLNGLDGILGTPDDDVRVLHGSPAIDGGDNFRVPADGADLDEDRDNSELLVFDKAYLDRFVDVPDVSDTGDGAPPVVDIGAFEDQALHVIFLDGFESGDTGRWSASS